MQTSDPEIQFGPFPAVLDSADDASTVPCTVLHDEGQESIDSSTPDDPVLQSSMIPGGDASTSLKDLPQLILHQQSSIEMQREQQEINRMRQENDELRKEIETMKLNKKMANLQLQDQSKFVNSTLQVEKQDVKKQNYNSSADRPRVRPANYDGSSSWTDYKVQFELLAELNDWEERQKAIYLAASLRGPAQSVLGDLDDERRRSYSALTAALGQRFGPENQTELFRVQLKNRLRRRDETLPELAQAIRRLTRQAYPSANYQLQETLAKEHFIDALNDTDIRWRVFQLRPTSLEDAVRVAVELEAFQVADRQRIGQRKPTARIINADEERQSEGNGKIHGQITTLTTNIEKILADGFRNLQKQLNAGSEKKTSNQDTTRTPAQRWQERQENRRQIECWNCNEIGHISRECPQPRQQTRQPYTRNHAGQSHQGNGQQSNIRADVRQSNPGPGRTNQQ